MANTLGSGRRNLGVAVVLAALGVAAWLLLGPAGGGTGTSSASADR